MLLYFYRFNHVLLLSFQFTLVAMSVHQIWITVFISWLSDTLFHCHRDHGWAVPWQRLCSQCSIQNTLRTLPTGLDSCWLVQMSACRTRWHWWGRHCVSYSRIRRSAVMHCESPCTWWVECLELFAFIFYDLHTFSILFFQPKIVCCKAAVMFITFENDCVICFWIFPHLSFLWDFLSCWLNVIPNLINISLLLLVYFL